MVVAVRDLFSQHLAEVAALTRARAESVAALGAPEAQEPPTEIAEALVELEVLCSWPEDEDELELALRFEALATALLDAMAAVEPLGC